MSNRVRVQQHPHGLFSVSIPRALVQALRIEKGEVHGVGPRGRGAGAEAPGEAREVGRGAQEQPDQPRAPHPGKSRRQAPVVTREWPADRPTQRPPAFPWPLVLMAGLLALVFMGLVPGRLLSTPAGLATTASLSGLCVLAYRQSLAAEDPADRPLRRAQRAFWLDEDPRGIRVRLRGVGLRGRPRLRRDITLRCLERAGRCDRLDRKLRREAARWLQAARDESSTEMSR